MMVNDRESEWPAAYRRAVALWRQENPGTESTWDDLPFPERDKYFMRAKKMLEAEALEGKSP